MCILKNTRILLLTVVIMGLLFSPTYAQEKSVSEPLTSAGAANYYDLKPNKYFVSLGVKGYQQTTPWTCGAAATMSLLRWYNVLTDADLTHATEMRIAKEMGMNGAITASALVTWLENNGFDVTTGNGGNVEMLRDNLDKGIPTIVLWSDWGGHYAVVTGYYAESEMRPDGRDTIFFADSSARFINRNNPDGITAFNSIHFDIMWFTGDHELPNVHRGKYITAVPHKK